MESIKKVFVSILALVLVLCFCFMPAFFTSFNDHSYNNVVVTDKVRTGGEDSKYLIFVTLEDGSTHVFENTDSFLRLKFGSSDMYGKITIGSTYDFNVVGFRIPILSGYENILSVQEVNK